MFTVLQACLFDIESIMQANECHKDNSYGFAEGQPCILLKMNKVSGKGVKTSVRYTNVQLV